MRLLTENSLGRRAAGGDERAFEELFRRFQGPLYGYCYSILGNQDDSLDALQNTMAKALDHLPGGDSDLAVKPWLYRVAHNECIDLIRSRRLTTDITEHDIACTAELESQVADRERLRQIIADLGRLPERQRNALVLRELNGLGFEEIGQSIGATPSAAKQIVYEARCSLQAESEGHEMACDSARQLISERDGRVLRSRKIRAHLRNCPDCTAFKDGIHERSGDLRALVPPLPLFAVASMLQAGTAVQGGSAVATSASGLATGGGIIGATGMKVVAVVAVAAGVSAVGVGVVERSGGDRGGSRAAVSSGSGTETSAIAGTNGVSYVEPGSGSGTNDGGGIKSSGGATDGNAGNEPGRESGSGSEAGPSQGSAPDSPGKSGSTPGNPNAGGVAGASGGSKGRGAVPTHGGKPATLPAAAQKGQQQAETSREKVVSTGRPAVKPTPPPPPVKPVQSSPPATKKADPKISSK